MGCKFSICYTKSINELLELGRREANSFGGFIDGNSQSGTFEVRALGGTFSGNYSVRGNLIEVNLDKKPLLIPCLAIEKFLLSNL